MRPEANCMPGRSLGKEAELNRHLITWLIPFLLPLLTGCGMMNFATRPVEPLAPVAFTGPPSLPEVMQIVNTNTQRVQQLHSDTASVSTPGFPSLRATLSVETPRRLRLRAKLFGPELDLGSNDEVFWFWLKSSGQPAVLFARHDQFAQSSAPQILPIEPTWVIEALGLVTLDPQGSYEGPFQRPDGKVEIRSRIFGGSGETIRTLVIDPTYGWVVEQHLADINNRPLATVIATNHRFYPNYGVSLPHRVEVRAASANLTFQIEVGQYFINRPVADPQETWSLPHISGQMPINLSSLPAEQWGATSGPSTPTQPLPQAYAPDPRTGYRPQYRGYSPTRR